MSNDPDYPHFKIVLDHNDGHGYTFGYLYVQESGYQAERTTTTQGSALVMLNHEWLAFIWALNRNPGGLTVVSGELLWQELKHSIVT